MTKIQEMLREACEDSGECNFRNDYSGRGMYGRQCVGITGTPQECMEVIGAVIKNQTATISAKAMAAGRSGEDTDINALADVENDFDESVDTLLSFAQDNMGMSGVIYYWPDLASIPAEVELDFGDLDSDH